MLFLLSPVPQPLFPVTPLSSFLGGLSTTPLAVVTDGEGDWLWRLPCPQASSPTRAAAWWWWRTYTPAPSSTGSATLRRSPHSPSAMMPRCPSCAWGHRARHRPAPWGPPGQHGACWSSLPSTQSQAGPLDCPRPSDLPPARQVLASASGCGGAASCCQIRIWAVPGGSCQQLLSYHHTAVQALAFSLDDRLLVTLGQLGWGKRGSGLWTPLPALGPLGSGCDHHAYPQGTMGTAPWPCGAQPPTSSCPPPTSRSRCTVWPSARGVLVSLPVWARAPSPCGSCSSAGPTSASRCQGSEVVWRTGPGCALARR